MKQIKLLYIRDMKKCINKRTLLIWIVMSILCVFFFFNSNGKNEFVTTNTIDFMSVMLPQVIFGAWAAMSVDFDLISADREHSVLDCILSSGITKNQIFVSKALTTASLCFIGALTYLIPVSCSIVYLGGRLEYLAVTINYLFPLWVYIMVYASWGYLISIIARSSKSALIWSLACGLALRPRFFARFVDGSGSVLHLTESIKSYISMIAPAILMSELTDISQVSKMITTLAVFGISILVLWFVAYYIFKKQDELNYSE